MDELEEVKQERDHYRKIAKEAVKLARFLIGNRGCVCNLPGHRCGTNQMLADAAALEEQIG